MMTEDSPRPAWHALEGRQVLSLLKGGDEGLTQAEADARLRHVGPNVFERTPPRLRSGKF